MAKINASRALLGGLVAGLVINAGEFLLNEPILGEQWRAAMESLNRPAIGGQAIAVFVLLGFALGIGCVYLYGAIRPRFGAGPKTAVCAGLLVWAFAYLYQSAGMMALGMFPASMIIIGTLWGLVEIPIATVLGAWLYREEG